jgi:hypothetical protein
MLSLFYKIDRMSSFDIRYSLFDIRFFEFLFRSDWPLFRQAVALIRDFFLNLRNPDAYCLLACQVPWSKGGRVNLYVPLKASPSADNFPEMVP